MAIELKGPACSLWARQILSTKGESDGLSSMVKIMLLPLIYYIFPTTQRSSQHQSPTISTGPNPDAFFSIDPPSIDHDDAAKRNQVSPFETLFKQAGSKLLRRLFAP
jgi:hypothetical protein